MSSPEQQRAQQRRTNAEIFAQKAPLSSTGGTTSIKYCAAHHQAEALETCSREVLDVLPGATEALNSEKGLAELIDFLGG